MGKKKVAVQKRKFGFNQLLIKQAKLPISVNLGVLIRCGKFIVNLNKLSLLWKNLGKTPAKNLFNPVWIKMNVEG